METSLPPPAWKKNLLFFVLTVLTTFAAGAVQEGTLVSVAASSSGVSAEYIGLIPTLLFVLLPLKLWPLVFAEGAPYALTLLGVLLFHEFGHYIAARRHHVDCTLPFFIPMPFFFIGTMGAVIRMQAPIRTRAALLDIGAAGPLAGLVVAIPALCWGVAHSQVGPLPTTPYIQEGASLFYVGIKALLHGAIPVGHDVMLHPVAWAAWIGILMTAINLLPIGQLDGGHIAYATFLQKHDRLSLGFHVLLFLSLPLTYMLGNFSGSWAFFGLVLMILMRGLGPKHPPLEEFSPLSRGRLFVSLLCFLFFVALFPPIPLTWKIP
jgi:membrane-associated protease RseP (regulator of RpoE activity)